MKASDLIAEQRAAGTYQEPVVGGFTDIEEDERPIVEELRALGVDTYGVHQLDGKGIDRIPGARAVLFEHLGRHDSEYIRSRLAANLGGPGMTDAEFEQLVAAYRSELSPRVQQQFAHAVSRCGPKRSRRRDRADHGPVARSQPRPVGARADPVPTATSQGHVAWAARRPRPQGRPRPPGEGLTGHP